MRDISLHHIVTPELAAVDVVRLASTLGCRHVCLFTHSPSPGWDLPIVDAGNLPNVRQAMADHQVTAYGVTSFPVTPEVKVSTYERALERSAALGAVYANVRIVDDDEGRATDAFGRLAEIAARYTIVASIEFTGYRVPDLLPKTLRILAAAGAGALSIDPLHIVRSGASLPLMRSLDPSLIGYVQLCDGPAEASEEDYRRESGANRLAPGEGVFPLADILDMAPPWRAVSLEVPGRGAHGVGPEERARHVVDAARRFLAQAEPG